MNGSWLSRQTAGARRLVDIAAAPALCLFTSVLACTAPSSDSPADVGVSRARVVAADDGLNSKADCDPHTWKRPGPGGGGAMYVPTLKPDDPQTAIVASEMGGTLLTRDGGHSWRMLKFNGTTTSIAFDPVSTATVYVGTNNGNVYRSVDAGERFSLLYPQPKSVIGEKFQGDHGEYEILSSDLTWLGPTYTVQAVLADPRGHSLFIAAGKGNAIELLRSANGGRTWSEVASLTGVTGLGGLMKLYVDPSSRGARRRLYAFTSDGAALVHVESHKVEALPVPVPSLTDATMGVDPKTKSPILYVTSGNTYNSTTAPSFATGAYRSTDGGKSWEEMLTGLDTRYVPGTDRTYNHIETGPTQPRIVYVSSVETTDGGRYGILKSTDSGSTWDWALEITKPVNKQLGWIERDYAPDWAGSPFFMRAATTNAETLYATDWGTTYRTTDGGSAWENLYTNVHREGTYSSRGLDVTNSDAVVFDPFDHRHVALVNSADVGLFQSHDGGQSWKHALAGVPKDWTGNIYGLVFDPSVRDKAWSVWTAVHDLPRYRYIRQPYVVDRYPGGVCVSTDGLDSWQCPSPPAGLPENSAPTSLVLDPESPISSRTLYATVMGRGVFKSTDGGNHWALKNDGILGNGLNDQTYAWQVVRAPNGTLYLLIARSARSGTTSKTANLNVATTGALYRSFDGAETWQPVALPAGVIFPNKMAFDPSNAQRAYLGCWPETLSLAGPPTPNYVDRHGGLYRTEDAGNSWVNVYDDQAHVYGVTVDPLHTDRVFIATFEGRILRSDDRGHNWKELGGFNFKWAKNPTVDYADPRGLLYVTTFGGGLWRGPVDGVFGVPPDVVPFH